MGTKANPGKFDCYEDALPDEPMFVLLARDPEFYALVDEWSKRRTLAVMCGDRPQSDMGMVREALDVAAAGAEWRTRNLGKWRRGA